MASDNPKSIKRTRKGGKRAKSGCLTCRARHVKCDEGKPSCWNCTSTGRKCENHEAIRAPASPWNDSSLTSVRTLGLPLNEQSNHFFHSFLHRCLPSLTEAMDSDFWSRSIQRASSSPTIQHAVIAFGATYEQRVATQNYHEKFDSNLSYQALDTISSLRYASAIRLLQSRIEELSWSPALVEEIMIACLIFVFMEILRGNDIAAATHLDGALKLYGSSQPTGQIQNVNSNVGTSADLEPLAKTFLRLDAQSVLYMGSRTPWSPNTSYQTVGDIPSLFDTFLDARDSLYVNLTNIMKFVTPPEGAETCFPGWRPHPDRGFDIYTIFHGSTYRDYNMPKAASQRRHFMHILSRWKSAFQGFLQKGTAKSPEALAGCALLWLVYYATRINLAVSYTYDECCYDEQLPAFKKIVELVDTYQKYTAHHPPLPLPRAQNDSASTIPPLKPKKTDFKVHLSVSYPLYYTALKCRYKPLRHVALEMLRKVENEGIWDARMLARIAEFVIAVEEETNHNTHGTLSDASDYGLPEKNRIHCLALNVVKSQRKIWLQYSRRKTGITTQETIPSTSDPLKRWRVDNAILFWKDSHDRDC